MTDKQIIIDKVNVKECEYYCNGKCERYEEFVDADYANYSVKCICEEENVLGTYDICDYQQLKREGQELQEAMDNYVQLDLQRVKEYNELVDLYKAKEQECEEFKEQLNQAKYLSEGALRLYSERQNINYKQALDDIENFLKTIMETNRVYPLQANLQKVLNIINKVKEQ